MGVLSNAVAQNEMLYNTENSVLFGSYVCSNLFCSLQ